MLVSLSENLLVNIIKPHRLVYPAQYGSPNQRLHGNTGTLRDPGLPNYIYSDICRHTQCYVKTFRFPMPINNYHTSIPISLPLLLFPSIPFPHTSVLSHIRTAPHPSHLHQVPISPCTAPIQYEIHELTATHGTPFQNHSPCLYYAFFKCYCTCRPK